jgi:hypothetical protein
MSNKISIAPPGIVRQLYNGAGNAVIPAIPSLESGNLDGFGQWLVAKCTPTNINSTFDPINGTQSNAGAVVDKNLNGFGLISKAYFFRLTAHRKPGATTALLDNTIIVSCGATEVGRVYADAATQKGGQHVWHSGSLGKSDPRFLLDGTADLGIGLTSVDPALEICIEIAGDD